MKLAPAKARAVAPSRGRFGAARQPSRHRFDNQPPATRYRVTPSRLTSRAYAPSSAPCEAAAAAQRARRRCHTAGVARQDPHVCRWVVAQVAIGFVIVGVVVGVIVGVVVDVVVSVVVVFGGFVVVVV